MLKYTKLIITLKVADENYYSFFKDGVLPNNSITTNRIKQVKTKHKDICIGIATKAILGQKDAFNNK